MQDRQGAIDKLCKQAIKERITQCETPKQFRQFSKFLILMANLRPRSTLHDKVDFLDRAFRAKINSFEDLIWVWLLATKEGDSRFDQALIKRAAQEFPDM